MNHYKLVAAQHWAHPIKGCGGGKKGMENVQGASLWERQVAVAWTDTNYSILSHFLPRHMNQIGKYAVQFIVPGHTYT